MLSVNDVTAKQDAVATDEPAPQSVAVPIAREPRGPYAARRARYDRIDDLLSEGMPLTRIRATIRAEYGIGVLQSKNDVACVLGRVQGGQGKRTPEVYIEALWVEADAADKAGQHSAAVNAIKAAAEIEPGPEFAHVRKSAAVTRGRRESMRTVQRRAGPARPSPSTARYSTRVAP